MSNVKADWINISLRVDKTQHEMLKALALKDKMYLQDLYYNSVKCYLEQIPYHKKRSALKLLEKYRK